MLRHGGPALEIRKIVAPALGVLLLGAVAAGIWHSSTSLADRRALEDRQRTEQSRQVVLRGLIGSEKEAFFADPRVRAELQALGLTVNVEKVGSRAIAGSYAPGSPYDFGFPSGAPAAALLRQQAKATRVFDPFYTPIVVASWRPVAEVLVANGLARKAGTGHYVLDMPRLLAVMQKGTRWSELKGNAVLQTSRAVLLASTDVRTSNSAAMYLSLASYVANGMQVVQAQEEIDRVLPVVAPLFLKQGFQETSSAGPFGDYLALGMGKTPMLIAYESQLVEFWLRHPERFSGTEMVVMYPSPTVYSKHVFVPYTEAGVRLGQALDTNPALRALAHEYGYRTAGDVKGPETWAKAGITLPEVLVDVVDPPSQEVLERMIVEIEQRFRQGN